MSIDDKEITVIDKYISTYPAKVQETLQKIREIVRNVAPSAEEVISYGVPTFKVNGKNFFHFGAYSHHIGIYPAGDIVETVPELKEYQTGKGTFQFKLNVPIPYDLIRKIAKYRFQLMT